jgi:hypothetical protein
VKRRALAFLGAAAAIVVLVASGCGSTSTVTKTVTVTGTTKSGVGPPGEQVQFGHIKSLEPRGKGYVMRFDPEWFLSGLTANVAAAEDGVVEPGQPVPNDNYRVEEGHRLLTYLVPANARVTVLAKGVSGTPVTVAQLAQIVDGKNPLGRPLFEPITTGFWVLINIDTVRSLDQQYQP